MGIYNRLTVDHRLRRELGVETLMAKRSTATKEPEAPAFDLSKKLWPMPLTLIGGSGKHESGKTLFGLSICPGPQTLVYDYEDSSAPYQEAIGFDRVDVPGVMVANTGKVDAEATFIWWRDHVLAQPPGKYRVIVIDPVTDLENGLTQWVRKHPQEFGYTPSQFSRMEGIMWECVKTFWKSLLLQISKRVECLYFVAHTKREWVGNTPTPNLLPKGKQTLFELASLYLFFDRSPVGGVKPQKPAANVLKSRVVKSEVKDGEVVFRVVLPPRLPVATPTAIREYMLAPADYEKLKPEEKWVEQKVTESDMLAMRSALAETELATEGLRMDRASLLARHGVQQQPVVETPEPTTDGPSAEGTARPADPEASAESNKPPVVIQKEMQVSPPPTTNKQAVEASLPPSLQFTEFDGVTHHHQKIEEFFGRLGVTDDQRSKILGKRNVEVIQQLDRSQTFDLLKALAERIEQKEGIPTGK